MTEATVTMGTSEGEGPITSLKNATGVHHQPPSLPPFVQLFSSGMYEYASALGEWSSSSYLEESGLSKVNCSSAVDCSNGFFDNDTWLRQLTNHSLIFNDTNVGNSTILQEDLGEVIVMAITSIILALIILVTIIGNVFVIAAIILERNLQNVANYLVASLAVADLMVACLVMPLGAVYEISKGWILGAELCDMWTSSDVLCCTASILHLVAIATDRYWAVTNVDYIHTRNERRIFTMIVLVWSVALVVSLAPQFGWKDPDYMDRITLQQRCLVSQDVSYQIFATCSTFYVPLLVILALYWKIFQTARKRIRRRREIGAEGDGAEDRRRRSNMKRRLLDLRRCGRRQNTGKDGKVRNAGNEEETERPKESKTAALLLAEGHSTTTVETVDESGCESHSNERRTTAFTISEKCSLPTANNGSADPERQSHNPHHPHHDKNKKESLEAKRERKAAKTLAIITGAFVVCWLPFFIMALVMPMCQACVINDYVASFFLWLGYFNSTLNPVIYTIFSPDFRQAFARILFGRHRRRRLDKY